MTVAYQPVDPAAGLPASRVPLAQLTGHFLCRRLRSSFGPATLIALIDEHRGIVCDCGARFDAQILTAERLTAKSANLIRSGQCPGCRAAHRTHLQFQSNGLILSQEADGWFVWLNPVNPDRRGNVMEEYLFWYSLDWTKQDSELAGELDVSKQLVRKWRAKVCEAAAEKAAGTRLSRRGDRRAHKR